MNLTFGILWIEDEYSKPEEQALQRAAAIAGFELKATNSIDGKDIDKLAARQDMFHEFDLILLDLTLDDGVKGDELAEEVRKRFSFTPILFYSSKEPEKDLRKRISDKRIEGVYCAHRDNFTTKAGEIIADIAKSLNGLSGMRGLAMEVVAEADMLCKAVVYKLCAEGYEDIVVGKLKHSVLQMAASTQENFPKHTKFSEQLATRSVDSMKLFGVFRDLVKEEIKKTENGEAKDELRALNNNLKHYREKVIGVRNTLGHALEEETHTGWQILDSDGAVFMTVSDFPEHRKTFLDSLRSIRELHRILCT